MSDQATTHQTTHKETGAFEELANLCENRAATYGLLSRLFRAEVDDSLLTELRAQRFPASTGNAHMDKGYRLIATYLSNAWENSLEELAVDYAKTFLGNGVDTFSAAYPFESVYVSEKRLLMQEARDEVLAIYRSYGMDKAEDWKEGEDHIALEMEFLQALCLRTARALRKGDDEQAERLLFTQQNFLEDHLGSWAPMLTNDMAKHAKTSFYQGLAALTEGFLEIDGEFLSEVIDGESDEAGFIAQSAPRND